MANFRVGAGNSNATLVNPDWQRQPSPQPDDYQYKYKAIALFDCEFYHLIVHPPFNVLITRSVDNADSDDVNEISFVKDKILDIVDIQGNWWQSRRADGLTGSEFFFIPSIVSFQFSYRFIVAPSNYLEII